MAALDRRTKEARHMEAVIEDLTAHCGGKPSAIERAMIERAAWLSLRCSLLDRKIASGEFSEHDSRTYLAWAGALTRLLQRLGPKAETAAPKASLADYLRGLPATPLPDDEPDEDEAEAPAPEAAK
jgi:hypothetical protein